MALRTYQVEVIDKLRQSLRMGSKRPVVMAPTGAGKTVIAAEIINMALNKGNKVIFCVPMLSLIDQTVERFKAAGIHEIGVMQGAHEMTDRRQPVQVCSIQTLMRRDLPEAQIVIIDECHVMFKFLPVWMAMERWKDVPFIGLSATPWQKGMGKHWDDLIIATTTAELIEMGHLSDFKTFAPAHPDLSGVKTVAGDYEVKGLAEAMDQGALVADVVSTWMERGENRPTVCFAVNRVHAKHIQTLFEEAGVPTAYMDAYSDLRERRQIVEDFSAGKIKIICNVGVLTTGFDADVRCIILARPTKSEILYVQMIGRGLRTAKGKDHCLILDHSDTTIRLGFVTDIHHEFLDEGKPKDARAEKKVALPKECPKCAFLKAPKTKTCPNCGFEAVAVNDVESVGGELYELTREKYVRPKDWPIDRKQDFYSELLLHAHLRGYKRGWAFHAYRSRLGVGPSNTMHDELADEISYETAAWIKHYNIAKAKAREKAEQHA
jgi:superfamily II DNA or RNA helicase